MNSNIKNIISLIAIIIALILAWKLKTILAYIIISFVLSLIGRPIMELLKKIKIKQHFIPSSIRSIITLSILVSFFLLIFSAFIPLIIEESKNISKINLNIVSENLDQPINDLKVWLNNKNLMFETEELKKEIFNLFSFTKFSSIFNSIIGILGNSAIAIFSMLFITFFLLKEKELANTVIFALTPENKRINIKNILNNTRKLLSRYFIGIIIQVSLITIIVSGALSFLDIKNFILIGFLVGVMNVIPYIGPIIGGLLGVLIAVTTNIHLDFYNELIPLSSKMILIFAIVQLIDNFIFQPLIFSNSVKAHPLEIFILVLSAGSIWGIIGMITAIPLYTLFRVIAKEFLSEFKVVEELTKNI